jgi:hypothetical protein
MAMQNAHNTITHNASHHNTRQNDTQSGLGVRSSWMPRRLHVPVAGRCCQRPSRRRSNHVGQTAACSPRPRRHCTGAHPVIHHAVYRWCPKRTLCRCPPRLSLVLATSFTIYYTCASRVIHHKVIAVYLLCSPQHPPHRVPVLATSSTTHE